MNKVGQIRLKKTAKTRLRASVTGIFWRFDFLRITIEYQIIDLL